MARRAGARRPRRKDASRARALPAATVQTVLYRNVGPGVLQRLSSLEKQKFYARSVEKAPDSRYAWQTVRSGLVSRVVAAKLEEKEYKVQAEELPLKVWLQRGWEEESVLNCPSREDEKLGVLYSVPVRVDTWRELVRCMEEEVCELERKLKKRKQGAAETEDDGLEVAPAKAAPSKDREAPKRKAGKTAKAETDPAKADLALAKNKQKTEKANQRAADLAARTLSVVTNFLKMSPVLETQLRGFKFLEEAETLQAARAEASAWRPAGPPREQQRHRSASV